MAGYGLVAQGTMGAQVSGTLSAANGVARWVAPCDGEIVGVTAAVTTAPVGSALTVDVNKGGTTIFTNQDNRPSIAAAGTYTAVKSASVTSFAAGDVFTIDVDAVGSSTAGAGLQVAISYVGK